MGDHIFVHKAKYLKAFIYLGIVHSNKNISKEFERSSIYRIQLFQFHLIVDSIYSSEPELNDTTYSCVSA